MTGSLSITDLEEKAFCLIAGEGEEERKKENQKKRDSKKQDKQNFFPY